MDMSNNASGSGPTGGSGVGSGSFCSNCDDDPFFVLSVHTERRDVALPAFTLHTQMQTVANGCSNNNVDTLCGYEVRNLARVFLKGHVPGCFYRLVYRRRQPQPQHRLGDFRFLASIASSGSVATTTGADHPDNGVGIVIIEGTFVRAEHEERRLMATEAGRHRFGVPVMSG